MKSKIAFFMFAMSVGFTAVHLAASASMASATQDAERELVRLMNQERTKQGVEPLKMEERLTEAARVHSEEMARRKQLSHRFPNEERLQDRLAKTGMPFDAVAENVAHSGSAADAHQELMLSSGHRANILNPAYNAVGVGVVERDGHLYVTQSFAHRLPEYDANDIERRVLSAFNALRKQKGQGAVKRTKLDQLRDFACEQEVTASRALQRFGGANLAVVFTGSAPDELPSQMQKVAGQSGISSIALGACPPSNTRSSYATFSVVALFYQ